MAISQVERPVSRIQKLPKVLRPVASFIRDAIQSARRLAGTNQDAFRPRRGPSEALGAWMATWPNSAR
jgi:hypothetical protein